MSNQLEKENAHLKDELKALKEQVQADGWFNAGMKIAHMLSSRMEVKSAGIVGGVADLITALDRKLLTSSTQLGPKSLLKREQELQEQLDSSIVENRKIRKKRDQAVAILALLEEQVDLSEAEDSLKALISELKSSIGSRALIIAKKELI
jgi:hypothetical protein